MLSILSYMRQGEYLLAIIAIFSRCFVVFCCMPIHEAAHAFVAYKLGDDTAKRQGRLTLNPLAHLNPLGTIMIFLFGIGYGQAVPVDEISKILRQVWHLPHLQVRFQTCFLAGFLFGCTTFYTDLLRQHRPHLPFLNFSFSRHR